MSKLYERIIWAKRSVRRRGVGMKVEELIESLKTHVQKADVYVIYPSNIHNTNFTDKFYITPYSETAIFIEVKK